MYVPPSFAEADPAELRAFLGRYSFAALVTQGEGGLVASHLPLLFDPEIGPNGGLLGHMARANPQWKDVRGEAMAIFSGPHAYVSPSWYEAEGTVPTWNYAVVHAYGTFHRIEDEVELLGILRRSVGTYEGGRAEPWIFDESSPHVGPMLRAIVGFRVEITRLAGKFKLSQNHPEERRARVIRGLAGEENPGSRAVAAIMAARERAATLSTLLAADGARDQQPGQESAGRGEDHQDGV
ncbi:MAG: FMN-binding negative transcriptional regulator [Isosphaeraceae bacterium]